MEKDARGWPVLKSTQDLECDGENPMTGRVCVLQDHRGHHRDESGAEWLDEGDLARPDWRIRHEPYDPRD